MAFSQQEQRQLKNFFDDSNFVEQGWLITDLDGTAIHECQGVHTIPNSVKSGLKKIYDLGRPVVINTLRFPLSVIRTFGKEWYSISNDSIPTILMNGSQLGYLVKVSEAEFAYEEIMAFPLQAEEINTVINQVESIVRDGITDLLVFYYPRNWTKGEIIWTPIAEKKEQILRKYSSASQVYVSPLEKLQEHLLSEDICMIFLLVDIPQDKLMAYQHTQKSSFFTRAGVNKLYGARKMAAHLGLQLAHAIGAGDTEMDTFLKGVGLPVYVTNRNLSFQGIRPAIKVDGSSGMGEILYELASLQKEAVLQ